VVSLGNRVGGIARPPDGPAVFIRGALPGEKVLAKTVSERKSHVEAELVEVIEPAPERVEPYCPMHSRCGGCPLQHLDYGHQLKWKKTWVEKALRGFPEASVEDALPSPQTAGFRNRATFLAVQGKPCFHAFRGNPISVTDCPALAPEGRNVLKSLCESEIPFGVESVSIRCSLYSRGTTVEIQGEAHSIPDTWGAVWGEGVTPRGAPFQEKLLDWVFPIPFGGFFQVNTRAAEKLLSTVLESARGERILDLYGGVGVFGVPLAARGASVDSVEINGNASGAANEAASLNGVRGFRALQERDSTYLSKALSSRRRYDTVILDPPRAGAGIRVMRMLHKLSSSRIVYVSCNPFTAARDMMILLEGGFDLKKASPVDMFPHSDHVETVFLLERIAL